MTNSIIKIDNMNKWFGDFQVLKNINLELEANKKILVFGQFVCRCFERCFSLTFFVDFWVNFWSTFRSNCWSTFWSTCCLTLWSTFCSTCWSIF